MYDTEKSGAQIVSTNNRWVADRCDFITEQLPAPPPTPEPAPQLKTIFLCMVPRSGSTFFGAMMRDNGLGNCVESFRVVKGMLEKDLEISGARTYEEYIKYKIAKHRRGEIFSSKVDWLQFIPIYYLGMWRKYFHDSHFIYLTREDLLMQAISRFIGTESGLFHSPQIAKAGTEKTEEVSYDFEKILGHIQHLIQMMSAWEMFFALEHITPFRLTYEKLTADPEGSLRAVANFCDVPLMGSVKIENEFEPVSGSLNDELRDRFLADIRVRQGGGRARAAFEHRPRREGREERHGGGEGRRERKGREGREGRKKAKAEPS